MQITWEEIFKGINGTLVFGKPEAEFAGISTDTRSIKPGELFIALKGPNFDGHDFIEKALAGGACGAIENRGRSKSSQVRGGFIIDVDDTMRALGDLARLWRKRHPIPVVAITGSNGKTTTKEMVSAILSQRYKVLKTEGNLNNLIGLPQMILKINDSHEVAVLELGMNVFGEIRRLSEICEPDLALITNIGPGHLEGVGSIDGVAKAKGEILEGLHRDGTFIINDDDPFVRQIAKAWNGKALRYGLESRDTDIKVVFIEYSHCYGSGMRLSMILGGKPLEVNLSGLGLHNAYNATAAAATAFALGIGDDEIKKGLEDWRPFKGRFDVQRLECGVNLVDDTYNSNPSSVAMAIKTITYVKGAGRGIIILGDMLELGTHAEEAHYEIGKKVAAAGMDYLFLLGPQSSVHTARGAREGGMAEERIIISIDHEEVSGLVNPMLKEGDWVLVKGSRGMAMEEVVERIKNPITPRSAPQE